MFEKALITAASNKFFPSLINLLGSIKVNYPSHPKIFIYDLGLFKIFRKELETIENVEVVDMPVFCGHWRSCYTWKTYIFTHPFAELNLYLDAGCQIEGSLDFAFEIIKSEGYYIIPQGRSVKDIVPVEYKTIFGIGDDWDNEECVDAGVLGFKREPKIKKILDEVYNAGLAGLALGFSKKDLWRNKGKDKNIFIRNCELFRHDLTLVNILFRKHIFPLVSHSEGPILKVRLNFKKLKYTQPKLLHPTTDFVTKFNRVLIQSGLFFRRIWFWFKGVNPPEKISNL